MALLGLSTKKTTKRRIAPGLSSLNTSALAQLGLFAQQGAGGVPSAASVNTTPGAQSGGYGVGYDINSDPAVAAAHGLAEKIRAQAQASALAKTKQAALEYGDPTGVSGLDQATIDAAKNNPFSILKNMEHAYTTGTQDLNEGLNKANLYYSGYRGQQLGEAARSYEQNKYTAGTNFRGLLTDINDQLANALLQADMYEQNALMNSTGGSYDSGGDSGTGGAGASNLYQYLTGGGYLSGLLNKGTPARPAAVNPYKVSATGYGPRGAVSTVNKKGKKVSPYGV